MISSCASSPLTHPMPVMNKDRVFRKLFVGGLPYHTNEVSLRRYFQRFGEIEEAAVITDKLTGRSRGYGFVSIEFVKRAAGSKAHGGQFGG